MQCYSELTPPTAVTHSLSLPFLSASANNLIVAKTSLLQVYLLKSVITHVNDRTPHSDAQESGGVKRELANGLDSSIPGSAATRGDRLHTTKLILVAQYELSGTITSLARVKISQSKSGGEALLVALRDAKLSLVEWDPERYSLSTISIHLYEREDILTNPWEPDLAQCLNYLSVDPSSRCAVLKFGKRHIAILPFHQTGDDLVMDDLEDDYDPDIDGERPGKGQSSAKDTVANVTNEKTPYAASFVLSLMALDPSLSHPIHLSFLYGYREPTFGVLYSEVQASSGLLHERRDIVSYAVYTLDLDQRASTTLLSVNKLPYDLSTIIPLSRAIGGALLTGGNEIIHVDQSGKTNGLGVNEFAKHSTSFGMVDQSDLKMKLEHCVVKELGLENTELLIVLETGELAILSFKIDGRSVSGLSIRRVTTEHGGNPALAGPSCASIVGRGRIFIGSEDSDSSILGWSRKSDRLKKQRSRTQMDLDGDEEGLDLDDEDLEDDEDDLYADTNTDEKAKELVASASPTDREDHVFRVHDSLMNLGPMTDIALQTYIRDRKGTAVLNDSRSTLGLMTTSGRGKAGGLTMLQQEICPKLVEQESLANAQRIWSLSMRQPLESDGHGMTHESFDTAVFAITARDSEEARPTAYWIRGADLEEVKDTEIFDADAGDTIEVGTLNGDTIIAQVTQTQVRMYDADFGLAQIYPLTDEESDEAQPKVLSASFADPYILVIRDDASAVVLTVDERGEIDEATKGEALKDGKWSSGSLYEDSNDVLRLEYPDDSEDEAGNVLMFLLSAAGGLQIFRLPNLQKPVYSTDGLSFLPPFLSTVFTIRRSSAKESLIEILVVELGDSTHKSPYLILRSEGDDLTIYQPYQSPIEGSEDTTLRFLKLPNPHLPSGPTDSSLDGEQQERRHPLRYLHDVGGYSAVFRPGSSPNFIIKSASSTPHEIPFAEASVKSIASFHTSNCQNGFIYINEEGNTRAARLPPHSTYNTGWVTQKIPLGEEVHTLSYHEQQDAYVLGTNTPVDFKLPEDDFHHQWNEEDTRFLPQTEQGALKLLDRSTLSVIDSYTLSPHETPLTLKTLSLTTSEHSPATQAPLIALGTTHLRGPDLPSTGSIYIFAITPVVPHPSAPHTNRAFRLIAKEETKGAITAISGVGSQGFFMVAQGQKVLVRGLKEDGTMLPVAFLDVQCFTSVARELSGSGLCVVGDARMGVRLVGYMEEPYALRIFSKSPHHIETMAAEFLPDGKQLYIVVADADCNLHILQFDPEHPKSLSGQRLLHHTTFHTGHFTSTMTLLPPSPSSPPNNSLQQRVLITTQSGSLALLTPLAPSAHRTLSSLQSHLQNTLPHHLGLNPRSYRVGGGGGNGGGSGVGVGYGGVGAGEGVGRGGGVVDGGVVKRWMEGGRWRWWGGAVGGGEEEGVREVVRGAVGGGVLG